jgi:aryl-alcohol dehydrogenase-like predicted oxidoreductase
MPIRPRSLSPTPSSPRADAAQLRASDAGTAKFRTHFEAQFAADYFRATTFGVSVSSIGIGTYLGDSTDADDAAYAAAIRHAFTRGINLIDTAINYRGQRSERAVGAAIQRALSAGEISRDQIVVCSKGGYIPLDPTPPATRQEYQAYVRREFIDTEILRPDELVAGGHSLAPRFLRYCLAKSRQNLGLRSIDVYYVHNPEQQLQNVAPPEVATRLRAAFGVLEDAASRGEIGVYGCATWDGLRVPVGDPGHLALGELVKIAREVAGEAHHFRVVQAPINLAMPEAIRLPTQPLNGRLLTVLDAAAELGLNVIASATLMQAKLCSGLPEPLRQALPSFETDAQRAIAFTRTVPGITAALVGMKRAEHVDENIRSAVAAIA